MGGDECIAAAGGEESMGCIKLLSIGESSSSSRSSGIKASDAGMVASEEGSCGDLCSPSLAVKAEEDEG